MPLHNSNAPESFHSQDSNTELSANPNNRKRSITKYDQDLIGNCTFTETRCRPLTAKRKIEFEPADDANNPPRKTVRIIRASAKSIARRLKANSLKKLALSAAESALTTASNGSNCEPENSFTYRPENSSNCQPGNSYNCQPDNSSNYRPENSSSCRPDNSSSCQPENNYQSCINDRLLTNNINSGPVKIKVKRRKKRPESCATMPTPFSNKDRPESCVGIAPFVSDKAKTDTCGETPPKTCDRSLSMQLNYSYTNLLNKFKAENSSSKYTSGGVSEPSNQRKYFREQSWQNSKDVYEFEEEDDAAILPQPPKIFSLSNKSEADDKAKKADFEPEKYSRKLKLTLKVKKDYVLDLNIDGKVRVLEPQYEVLRLQAD